MEIKVKFIISQNSVLERPEDSKPFKKKRILMINVVQAPSASSQQS